MWPKEQKFGHYQIKEMIGKGGMGEVHRAVDENTSREVAVKSVVVDAGTKEGQKSMALFRSEMKVLASMDHPYILPLFDFGEESDNHFTCLYIVTPYCHDGSLKDWLEKAQTQNTESLPIKEVQHFLSLAAESLQYMHDKGVTHCDIKPANFLLRKRKNKPLPDLLLADFGLARFKDVTQETRAGLGTPSYIAPEQWDGNAVPESDQYSLAIMAYEMLVGDVPFESPNVLATIYRHKEELPKPLSESNQKIPKSVDTVILRALAKKSKERYISISEFAQAFRDALKPGKDINIELVIAKEEAISGIDTVVILNDNEPILVHIPEKVKDGQKISLSGKGEIPADGRVAGNLIVTVRILPSEQNNTFHSLQLSKNIVDQLLMIDDYQKINLHLEMLSDEVIALRSTLVQNQDIIEQIKLVNQRLDESQTDMIAKDNGAVDQTLTDTISKLEVSIKEETAKIRADLLESVNTPRVYQRISLFQLLMVVMISVFLIVTTVVGYSQLSNLSTKTDGIAAQLSAKTNNIATQLSVDERNPYPPYTGALILSESLVNDSANWGWDTAGICGFANGAYTLALQDAPQDAPFVTCTAENSRDLNNFTFQVSMIVFAGGCGGIVFRNDKDANNFDYYLFEVCQDGRYGLFLDGTSKTLISLRKDPAIITGLKQTNIIAVVANGKQFDLYVNHQKVNSYQDITHVRGRIGLFMNPNGTIPTWVAFNNAEVWV